MKTANALWDLVDLSVGIDSHGDLEVTDGGDVLSQEAVLGENFAGVGIASVTSAASNWATRTLVVGKKGVAGLTIKEGAIVTGREIVIGSETGSIGVVELSDSSSLLQNSTDDLMIGLTGDGTVDS